MKAWLALASGVGAVGLALRAPIGGDAAVVNADRLSPPVAAVVRGYPTDSFVAATVSRDPFRAGRRPAGVPYDPVRGAASPEGIASPKPALALVGLVLGSTPSAVIEGFPGMEGSRVVRVGEIVSGLQVKTIERDRVVIVGMDTTWTLRVREPWH